MQERCSRLGKCDLCQCARRSYEQAQDIAAGDTAIGDHTIASCSCGDRCKVPRGRSWSRAGHVGGLCLATVRHRSLLQTCAQARLSGMLCDPFSVLHLHTCNQTWLLHTLSAVLNSSTCYQAARSMCNTRIGSEMSTSVQGTSRKCRRLAHLHLCVPCVPTRLQDNSNSTYGLSLL